MAYKVIEIEGVGEVYAEKLVARQFGKDGFFHGRKTLP